MTLGGLEFWHIGLVQKNLLFVVSCLYIIKIKIKIGYFARLLGMQ